MMHLLVTFQLEELRDRDTSIIANASEIIPFQIGNHNQFSDFLDGSDEVVRISLIPLRVSSPWLGAFDRAGDNSATANLEKAFGRCCRDLSSPEIKKCGIGRGGVMAQRLIERPRIPEMLRFKRMGQTHLIDISCGDILLRLPHHALEFVSLNSGFERKLGKRGPIEQSRELLSIVPNTQPVEKDRWFLVKAKSEVTIETDPTYGSAIRDAEVSSGSLAGCQLALQSTPLRSIAFDDKVGFASYQRKRVWTGQAGVQEDEAATRSHCSSGFFRTPGEGRCMVKRSGHYARKSPKLGLRSMFFCLSNRLRAAYLMLMSPKLRLFIAVLVPLAPLFAQEPVSPSTAVQSVPSSSPERAPTIPPVAPAPPSTIPPAGESDAIPLEGGAPLETAPIRPDEGMPDEALTRPEALIPDERPSVPPAVPPTFESAQEKARQISIRYREVRVQAEKDPKVVSLLQQAERAKTLEDQRAAMREYLSAPV